MFLQFSPYVMHQATTVDAQREIIISSIFTAKKTQTYKTTVASFNVFINS